MTQLTAMHTRLRFSWGHILAFLGIIAGGFFTFEGVVYATSGDFMLGYLLMGAFMAIIGLFFILPQVFKASDSRMKQKIWIERVLIFMAPMILAVLLLPASHMMQVHNQNDKMVADFNHAMTSANAMFDEYQQYADDRIQAQDDYMAATKMSPYERDNAREILTLQLLGANIDSLRTLATDWMKDADKGANSWNVFLMGNIDEIDASITEWEKILHDISSNTLSTESSDSLSFSSLSAATAHQALKNVHDTFTRTSWTPQPIMAVIWIGLYILLMLPYLLQARHPKSTYKFIPWHNSKVQGYHADTAPLSSSNNDNTFNPDGF